jgi:rhodanese-related sulfurtransferase
VDTVVFVNSPGGDLWTGLRVGRLIADKGYKTVIAGSCVSACSIMFMGGKQRQFSDALRPNQTFIGIHGAHNKDTKQVNTQAQPQIYAFYKLSMGERFNSEVMNQALYDMEDSGSLLRVFDPVRSNKTAPYHCKSSHTPRIQCTSLEGKDAVNLGIVTQAELVTVNLPVNFQPVTKLLGQVLSSDTSEFDTNLEQFASSHCRNATTCKNIITKNYTAYEEDKALAIAHQGSGFAWSLKLDSPAVAYLRSLYLCNHPANAAARLCRVKYVNKHDISTWYAQADAAHKEALAMIRPPTEKNYANEEFGGSLSVAKAIRVDKYQDMTPVSIEGVTTITTQALASTIMQARDKGIYLIDVVGFHESIPGSQIIVNAGIAHHDVARDEALEKRISALLKLLIPDMNSPVIFFCTGRDSWLSVNASLRARKLGYTNVSWYRGGLQAWQQAQLPTARSIAQASAN